MAVPAGRRRFLNNAIRIALVIQLPSAWLLFRSLSLAGLPLPGLITLALLIWWNIGLVQYIQHAFPERPIPTGIRVGVVLPFFLWFLTSGTVLIPGLFLAMLRFAAGMFASASTAAIWTLRLDLTGTVLLLLALGLALYACFVRPRWVKTTEHDIQIANLPAAFDGFRIVQLSDLHVGNFATRDWLDRWVNHANRLDADLVAVTGDLLNSGDHFMQVVADGLSRLKGREGVVVSMGNHDYWSGGDVLASTLESAGLEVMRNAGRLLNRKGDSIYLAAVDDTWSDRADLGLALSGWPRNMPAILLSHDPALYPAAASAGVALTLSGHTHGGQLAIPFKDQWNLSARVFRFHSGLYQHGPASLFVHRGLGTTGPPVRIGAAPEIAVLTLRRAWKHLGATMLKRNLAPIHPGEVLLEDFMKPLNLSQHGLAHIVTFTKKSREICSISTRLTGKPAKRASSWSRVYM